MPALIGEFEVVNEVRLAPSSALYDGAVVADSDLTIQVNPFYYSIGGSYGRFTGAIGVAVNDNSVNYVYVDSTNALHVNTSGYPAEGHIRLARVFAQAGVIVKVSLERALLSSGGSTASQSAKAGSIVPGSFSGSPRKAVVAFATPYTSNAYSVALAVATDGSRTFAAYIENKTVTGFTVNLNSNNPAGLIEIGWHAMSHGS